jgi:hypothetical protein
MQKFSLKKFTLVLNFSAVISEGQNNEIFVIKNER